MTSQDSSAKLRVLIVGGGVAALETALALHELAPGLLTTTVIAPNEELVNRPMTVREPFAHPRAHRYPIAPIVADAGAELLVDELAWVDPGKRILHTGSDAAIEYDELVLALGGWISPRYEHAITIDDRKLDETLHGLIQDIEEGYVASLAFVAPGRMAWPLPLYELALMTAARAYDMNVELETTIVTPEGSPLAIFGSTVSSAVEEILRQGRVKMINSAYAEVPHQGEILVNPGYRRASMASFASTSTAASTESTTSTRRATRRPSRSSKAASAASRQTPQPNRSPRWPVPRSRQSHSDRSSGACC